MRHAGNCKHKLRLESYLRFDSLCARLPLPFPGDYVNEDKRGTLHEKTLLLLKAQENKKTLVQIHHETRIPFHWLSAFRQEVMRNPSVNRVQRLYEHLAGQPLAI